VGTSSLYDVIDSATCTNCGTSIQPKAKFCSGCGASGPEARTSEGTLAYAEGHALDDHPKAKSSSLDNLLLSLAVLLFVGLCFTIVGIIPVLIMTVGVVLAFRSGDVKNMKVTARFVQVIAILGALIGGFIAVTENPNQANTVALVLSFALVPVVLIIEFLWIGPLTRQLPVWRAARSHKKTTATKTRIIGRDSLTPYSIADELLKWNQLRADGLITEDEYQEARTNLLSRR
jgi:zinc-ribbon domain